jgi:hypothetical protein
MNRLDETAFKATFREPMQRVGDDEEPPFDFWTYFEQIPEADFEGFDCSEGQVDIAWRTGDGRFEHILVNTREDLDAFMVIVLDRDTNSVLGHRFLNLKKEYGIDSQIAG